MGIETKFYPSCIATALGPEISRYLILLKNSKIPDPLVKRLIWDSLIFSAVMVYLPWPRAIYITFPGRYSDYRIILITAPSRHLVSGKIAAFVPEYSGGPVPDSHRVPF